MSDFDPNLGFIARAQRIFLWIGAAYAAFLVLLLVPPIQRQAVYLHAVRWPLFATFDAPHWHGLALHKTANIRIQTSLNQTIGAWYVLSEPAYQASGGNKRTGPPTSADIRKSLEEHPTVLFFHGNAASRAVTYRVQMYSQVNSRLRANVLVIDYRGFADSDGSPNEPNLNADALATWNWLISSGAKPENIIVFGQSLGTGVSAKLVSQLASQGVSPRALVLTAPFASIAKLLQTYSFGGYFPLLKPLQMIPFATEMILGLVHTRFSTIDLIPDVDCPILFVHAKDDMTIPSSHSSDLFNTVLEPYLPTWPFDPSGFSILSMTNDQLLQVGVVAEAREKAIAELVTTSQLGPDDAPFGTLREFIDEKKGRRRAVFLETEYGGHSEIVRWEAVIDMVGDIAGISRS